MQYTCLINNTAKTGYDPRCRSWYVLAVADQSIIQFTEPYVDAQTGWVMITLSQAVLVNNEFIGVVAADLSMNHLSTFVLAAKVLETGYTYMCTSGSVLVVHPDVDIGDGNVYYINDKEFTNDSDDTEKDAFAAILTEFVFVGSTGLQKFMKNGATWYVTYGKVINTDYYLLIVVPESEVLDPAVSIKDYADDSMVFITILVSCISIVCVSIGGYYAIILANKVAGPIEAFNKVLQDISANQFHEYKSAVEAENDFKEINHLQSKIHNLFLAVKFNNSAYQEGQDYDEALAYLTEVEDMFDMIKQKRALGDIYNNRGRCVCVC